MLHRLDMDTTGVMLFAKEPHVVSTMHEQFRSRTVSKTYAAICLGAPSAVSFQHITRAECTGGTQNSAWEVHAPLTRHPSIATACCVSSSGKPAHTHIILRAENCSQHWQGSTLGEAWFQPKGQPMSGVCLLECKPVTGAPLPDSVVALW